LADDADGGERPVIDVHTHLIRRGCSPPFGAGLRTQPLGARASDRAGRRCARPARAGRGEVRLLLLRAQAGYGAATSTTWLAQTGRDLGAGAVPLATVTSDDPDPGRHMRDALRDGCAGLKVHENVQGFGLDHPRLAGTLRRPSRTAEGFVLVVTSVRSRGRTTPRTVRRGSRACLRRTPRSHRRRALRRPRSAAVSRFMQSDARLFLDTTMAFAPDSPMRIDVARADVGTRCAADVYGTDWPNITASVRRRAARPARARLTDATLRAITSENARRLTPASRSATPSRRWRRGQAAQPGGQPDQEDAGQDRHTR